MSHKGKFREERPGVYYLLRPAEVVSSADIDWLKSELTTKGLTRGRICSHPDPNAAVHEMMIVLTSKDVVIPHKHPTRDESYHLISGSMELVLFSEDGAITETIVLGEKGAWYVRIPANIYHTVIPKTDWVAFHETGAGPFDQKNTVFAPWK